MSIGRKTQRSEMLDRNPIIDSPDIIDTLEELCIRAIDNGVDYVVLKPYVHNIYMKQEGYKDSLDYSKSICRDKVLDLMQSLKTQRALV